MSEVMATKYFDTLGFVQKSKELGVPEPIATFQARQIEQAIAAAVTVVKEELKPEESITKIDIRVIKDDVQDLKADVQVIKEDVQTVKADVHSLELKIEQYKYDTLKFTIWTGIGVIVAIGGMLAKGFHWV